MAPPSKWFFSVLALPTKGEVDAIGLGSVLGSGFQDHIGNGGVVGVGQADVNAPYAPLAGALGGGAVESDRRRAVLAADVLFAKARCTAC